MNDGYGRRQRHRSRRARRARAATDRGSLPRDRARDGDGRGAGGQSVRRGPSPDALALIDLHAPKGWLLTYTRRTAAKSVDVANCSKVGEGRWSVAPHRGPIAAIFAIPKPRLHEAYWENDFGTRFLGRSEYDERGLINDASNPHRPFLSESSDSGIWNWRQV